MSLTKKVLIEALNGVSDDAVIKMQDNSDIVHITCSDTVILSTQHKVGYCNKCGNTAFAEDRVKGYYAICPNCDENLYKFEVTKHDEEAGK